MRCTYCDNEIRAKISFCPYCGNKLVRYARVGEDGIHSSVSCTLTFCVPLTSLLAVGKYELYIDNTFSGVFGSLNPLKIIVPAGAHSVTVMRRHGAFDNFRQRNKALYEKTVDIVPEMVFCILRMSRRPLSLPFESFGADIDFTGRQTYFSKHTK